MKSSFIVVVQSGLWVNRVCAFFDGTRLSHLNIHEVNDKPEVTETNEANRVVVECNSTYFGGSEASQKYIEQQGPEASDKVGLLFIPVLEELLGKKTNKKKTD